MKAEDILKDLTEPQREAVTHVDGPLLVIAGAGSGKTRVITRRVAHLVATGIEPWHVLAITFTNKAAGEMKERISQLVDRRGVWVSTFHSMCARMLRQYPQQHGIDPNFTIADSADQLALVKEAMGRLQLSKENFPPAALAAAISRAKNQLRSPEQFASDAHDFFGEKAAAVYRIYQKLLDGNHTLDFDDLLMKVALLLRENRDFLDFWSDRFHHLLIDEYQDTNHAQYLIARSLAAARRNICATGDPDQSIYGWRGADISNILEFKRDYRDAKVVKLEQNYRSTKTILEAANAVIVNNRRRIERGMWTENAAGEPLRILLCRNEQAEGEAIALEAQRLQDAGVPFAGMAVFYRTHAQSRPIEQALLRAKVRYTILDAVTFYARQEIKDVLSYLRLCVNPADDLSLERIINLPPRGIGKTTIDRLKLRAQEQQVSLLDAVHRIDEIAELNDRAKEAVKAFDELLKTICGEKTFPVNEFIGTVLERSGYKKLLSAKGENERLENVSELVNAAAEYDAQNPEGSLGGFLEQVALVSDIDKEEGADDKVSLMTLHSAKGLEFPVVFIPGCEEDLLPHANSMDKESELEEERRLFYVGMTRAKERLVLLHAFQRARWGKTEVCMPSRFLDEIPARFVEEVSREEDDWHLGSGGGDDVLTLASDTQEESPEPPARTRPKRTAARIEEDSGRAIELEPEELASGGGLSKGDRVRHETFGPGRVVEVYGPARERRAKVYFEQAGMKTLVLKYARLVKIVAR